MPVPKVPAWGDSARLGQLASGLKRENGTYGAVVQRNEPGRPTGSGAQPQSQPTMPDDHAQGARKLAQAVWAQKFFEAMAQRFPNDPLVEMYAANSARVASQLTNEFQSSTPFFEF